MNAASSLIQQTRQIDGRRAAANDRDTPAGKRSKITIVEAVRNILGPKPTERRGEVAKMSNSDRDHNTPSVSYIAVIQEQCEVLAVAIDGNDHLFFESGHEFGL